MTRFNPPTFRDWLAASAVFLVALLMLTPQEYKLSFDFSKYLAIGAGLDSGYGFTEPEGRTALYRSGYTLLISALLKLFGHTEATIVYLSIAAAATIPAALTIAGKQLHSLWTGIIAAGLVIFSANFIVLAPRHLDPLWPALLLLSLILLLYACDKRSIWPALLCGLTTALAISIKEFSVLFAFSAVGILYLYGSDYRPLRTYVTALAAGIVLWLSLVVLINGDFFDPRSMFNYADKTNDDLGKQTAKHGNLIEYAWFGLKQLLIAPVASGGILRQYALGLGISAGLVITCLWAAATRRRSAVVLALLIVAFLPIALLMSARGMRLMQSLWLQLIGFLCFALCWQWSLRRLMQRRRARWRHTEKIIVAGVNTVVLAALMLYSYRHDTQAEVLAASPRAWLNPPLADAGHARMIIVRGPCYGIGGLLADDQGTTRVVSDHRKVLETIRWETPHIETLVRLSPLKVDPLSPNHRARMASFDQQMALVDVQHPTLTVTNRLNFFPTSAVEEALQHANMAVVLTHRAQGVGELLAHSNAFEPIGRISSRWTCTIYRPLDATPSVTLANRTVITDNAKRYLRWLESEYPDVHAQVNRYLETLNRQ